MRVGANRMRVSGLGRPLTCLSGREWYFDSTRGDGWTLLPRACRVGACSLLLFITISLYCTALRYCTGNYNIYVPQIGSAVITLHEGYPWGILWG